MGINRLMLVINNTSLVIYNQTKSLVLECLARKHGNREKMIKEFKRRLRPILVPKVLRDYEFFNLVKECDFNQMLDYYGELE